MLASLLASLVAPSCAWGQVSLLTGLDSDYVSEGRKQLRERGFATVFTGLERRPWLLEAWYGVGNDGDYRELNLTAGAVLPVGPAEVGLTYTRLEFSGTEDSFDNEFAVSATWGFAPSWSADLAATYSTEAKGTFVEIMLRREWLLWEDRLALALYVLEGFDFGYASEAYDGPNHLHAGVELGLPLTKSAVVTAYLAHCWAHGDVRREGLGGFFFGGVGLSAGF